MTDWHGNRQCGAGISKDSNSVISFPNLVMGVVVVQQYCYRVYCCQAIVPLILDKPTSRNLSIPEGFPLVYTVLFSHESC